MVLFLQKLILFYVYLPESIITPKELHFVRNHLPVPNIDIEKYEIQIINEFTGKNDSLKFDDLKNHFPIYKIPDE